MVTVTIGSQSWTGEDLASLPEDCTRAMVAAYANGTPPQIATAPAATMPAQAVAEAVGKGFNEFGGSLRDEEAAKRIEAQHAALNAAGVKVDSKVQVAATGTRMMRQGYETQANRKAEHDAQRALVDVAHDLDARIAREHREDATLSAGELARSLTVNGKIHVAGKALTEQAIRGLATRLESPMLGYVLGLRERIMSGESKGDDKARIAEVLRHELLQASDTTLKLRMRNGGCDDIYAVVSPSYVEADAPSILPEILAVLPEDTRATFAYDPTSTQWEIRASVWTPTPVEEQAIGEAFEGYVSLRSRDNGTSRFRGDGGVTLIACYNAGTYNAGGEAVSRVHRGKVSHDIRAMIYAASKSINVLCQAWGKARQTIVEQPKDAGAEFLAALWTDMLRSKPLVGVLAGGMSNVPGLVSAYHAERRDPERLVRADLAQAWTRHIQDQPASNRRDAEAAIGSWLVGVNHGS